MAKRSVDRNDSRLSVFVPYLLRMFPIPFSQPVIRVLRRDGAEFHSLFVEKTEIQIHKIDPPDAIFFLFETDGLISQCLADVEGLVVPETDAARGLNDSHQVVMSIDRFGQLVGI